MNILKCLITLIFIFFINISFSQIENLKDDFSFPLKLSPSLSGNFGEPRARHFHAGVDFRTHGENKEIYSIADGYISRIFISPWGYGLALYVTHPNGYTSVYAHLNKFKPEVQNFIKKAQYERQSFYIDTVIPSDLFPVKKNDIIAYSGNTGSSEGPHLHFEIRETETNFSVNTINSVYKITDNIRPVVNSIVIYPISDNTTVEGKTQKKLFSTILKQAGNYELEGNISPKANGTIGIGVGYIDKITDSPFRFGAETVKLFVNDSIYYHSSMTKICFDNQRCKNSLFDYEHYLSQNTKHIQKTFVEPNNNLDMFIHLTDNGIFDIKSGENKKIKIEITDFNGNTSYVNFNIKGDLESLNKSTDLENKLKWDIDNILLFESLRIEIDSASLFSDNLIKVEKKGNKSYSPSYKIGKDDIALNKDIKISLYIDDNALKYKDKLVISKLFNGRKNALRSKREQNFISAYSNSFGEFYLEVDTIPPKITPKNISWGANLTNNNYIEINITDNLSGIDKYDLYINDKWVLGEYDAKTNRIRYYFDEYFPKSSSYEFKAIVSDCSGNTSEYKCKFNK